MTSTGARFGIVFLPESLGDFGSLCREAEEAGFDLLGVADSQSVFRELYVALAIAARDTSRIRLGPLVTNPQTRHLVVTASAISSIDELSGGRAMLGLGSGDSAIYTLGAPPSTVAGLEDAVVTLGQLTSGALVERDHRKWQVRRSTRRVPIYLASEGPRTLELAGRVADGVIVGLGLTPEVISVSLAAIERGARAAGRTLEDLDIWWFAKTNVADTREGAVAPIKMALAASANHAFRFTLEGKAVPPDLHERIRGLQKEYDAHQHEIAGAANADLTERWGLTEFLRDRFAIEVSHWHSLHDSAYLRHLLTLPDAQLVGVQDPSAKVAAERAAVLGNPPVFTDYGRMLADTHPDFVIALGRHSVMAETAHYLLDHGYPFLMEKPMGINATEVRRVADKAAAKQAFVAVPLAQRYLPFTTRARALLAEGRFGPLSHIYFRLNRPTSGRYPAWGAPWMLDPAVAGGGCLRNLGPHGLDLFLYLTGEEAQVTGAQVRRRALGERVEDYASVLVRSRGGVLGTIELGNGYPRNGTDGEWKIAGRDAILSMRDDVLRLVTSASEETAPAPLPEPIALTALRDALDHWRRGAAPPIGVEDCARVAVLIDRAYELAASAGV